MTEVPEAEELESSAMDTKNSVINVRSSEGRVQTPASSRNGIAFIDGDYENKPDFATGKKKHSYDIASIFKPPTEVIEHHGSVSN